jgi:hypothetical protein
MKKGERRKEKVSRHAQFQGAAASSCQPQENGGLRVAADRFSLDA